MFKDLGKAKKNVQEFNLPNKVKYFYSYPLSNLRILKYRKKAKDELNIILEIIEAKTLAQTAEIFDSIREEILNLSNYENLQGNSNFFENDKVKAFYDLMSIGTTTDIKYNIIKSYIINYLYSNGETTQKSIIHSVNEQFDSKLSKDYFESILRRMNSEQKIKKLENSNIELTEKEKNRLEDVLDNYKLEEALIRKKIIDILKKYGLENHIEEIIRELSELYESNYSINISEFTLKNSNISDLETSTNKFVQFITSKGIKRGIAEKLVASILKVADENQIISRIAAGQVFSKVSDPDRLEDYISQNHKNKEVFIDTNVLVNLLLAHYEPDANYDDYHYKVANQFLKFAQNNNLTLKTIRRYAVETTNLFKNALSLIPFTKLPYFNALGRTNNILYNFYQHLSDWNMLASGINDFEDFLMEFRFEIKSDIQKYSYRSQMEYLLDSLNVRIEELYEYNLESPRRMIGQVLQEDSRTKSNFAITSDSIMLERLADTDVDINPMEPIFCTWDLSLMKVRKIYFKEFLGCTKWFMYTPTRLMDHFSMMNLKVRKGTLSNEVLSILEESYDFKQKTQSLLDSVKAIINPNNEIGLRYTNKLAELREKEIIQIEHVENEIPELDKEKNSVDVVFSELLNTYQNNNEEDDLQSLKLLFTKDELFDKVIHVINQEIEYVNKHNHVSEDLFKEVDSLIKIME